MNATDVRTEPPLRHIFFPSDLSPESDRAFQHVRLLASRFGAHTTVYHVLEIPAARWIRAAGREEELRRTVAAEVTRELTARAEALTGTHDVLVDADVSAPSALADIAVLRRVRERNPDLIVMASHSRGALGSFFLGSVAQQVLQNAGRPVLVIGPGCRTRPDTYARVVVATDLSEVSRRAFPIAGLLASRFDADVVAVYAVPRPLLTALADHPQALAAVVPSAATLRSFVADFAGCRVTPRVEQGAAWERIVAVAREEKADLIVMATQGADSLGDRLLGSQTERVIRHAPCPVLAV
jgi:nucleotide-binding universal stress UspA family protein